MVEVLTRKERSVIRMRELQKVTRKMNCEDTLNLMWEMVNGATERGVG